MTRLRSAFTLVEVNLAIFIMATGVLAMVSLYSLGFRESQQSRDDVAATGYADAFLAPLVSALSATNVTWSAWTGSDQGASGGQNARYDSLWPAKGWGSYVRHVGSSRSMTFRIESSWQSTADGVFRDLMNIQKDSRFQGQLPTGDKAPPCYALVATRRGGTISIAFRASRRKEQLMSQPVSYTEIHFQGDPNQ